MRYQRPENSIRDGKAYDFELKALTGALTADQQEAQEALRTAGATVAVTHGLGAAIEILEPWGFLRGVSRLSRS